MRIGSCASRTAHRAVPLTWGRLPRLPLATPNRPGGPATQPTRYTGSAPFAPAGNTGAAVSAAAGDVVVKVSAAAVAQSWCPATRARIRGEALQAVSTTPAAPGSTAGLAGVALTPRQVSPALRTTRRGTAFWAIRCSSRTEPMSAAPAGAIAPRAGVAWRDRMAQEHDERRTKQAGPNERCWPGG
jgi:hypothetical protein